MPIDRYNCHENSRGEFSLSPASLFICRNLSFICQKNSLEKQNLSFSWIFMQSNLNIHISGLAGLCNIMMAFIHTYIWVRIPELVLHYQLKGIMFKIVVTLNRSNNNILKFLYPRFQHTSIVIVSSVI